MPILNYTTSIEVDKSVGQIQAIIGKAGANKIMIDYDNGIPSGIVFSIMTGEGLRGFVLPVKVAQVWKVLEADPKVPARMSTEEQAQRVAWRITKDWLEAQLAIVETEMVTFEEVMLPYMRANEKQTIYEVYKAGNLPALKAAK